MAQQLPRLEAINHEITTSSIDVLPRHIPSLVNQVLRCGTILSTAHDPKSRSYTCVHALRCHISTMLNGQHVKSRFTGTVLAKAFTHAGGREALQMAEPWVRAIMKILQKKDPLPSKQVAMATVTAIYLAAHKHPTVVREVVTPTLPDYIQSCLQLSSKSNSSATTEALYSSFAVLVPLHPATFRPFMKQIWLSTRQHLAPTRFDAIYTPPSLRKSAQELMALLPYTAAKNGSCDEWAALVHGLLTNIHHTIDQVFRCIEEPGPPSFKYNREQVAMDHQPCGHGKGDDDLPEWAGIAAGGDRLVGLLNYLTTVISSPTKAAVSAPLASFIEVCTRLAYMTPAASNSGLQFNPETERDEKSCLFAAFPDIHTSCLVLLGVLARRFDQAILPHFSEMLGCVSLFFGTCPEVSQLRKTVYDTLLKLFPVGGSTIDKEGVVLLHPLIMGACRDLHAAAGHFVELEKENAEKRNQDKAKSGVPINVDRFLPTHTTSNSAKAASNPPSDSIAEHVSSDAVALVGSAEAFLVSCYTNLPQEHLKSPLRSFMDHTAITCVSKDAMVASVLNPYPAQEGKVIPSLLPYLVQQFPNDQVMEILRSNIQTRKAVDGELIQDSATALKHLQANNSSNESEFMENQEQENDVVNDVKVATVVVKNIEKVNDYESEENRQKLDRVSEHGLNDLADEMLVGSAMSNGPVATTNRYKGLEQQVKRAVADSKPLFSNEAVIPDSYTAVTVTTTTTAVVEEVNPFKRKHADDNGPPATPSKKEKLAGDAIVELEGDGNWDSDGPIPQLEMEFLDDEDDNDSDGKELEES